MIEKLKHDWKVRGVFSEPQRHHQWPDGTNKLKFFFSIVIR